MGSGDAPRPVTTRGSTLRLHRARRLGALTSAILMATALAVPAAAAPSDRADELRDRADALRSEVSAFGTADAFAPAQDELVDVGATEDLRFACPQDRVPGGSFTDTAAPFAAAIDCLVWYGVTQGRTATTFDQPGTVTRAQMAVFVHRMLDTTLDLPVYDGTSAFRDVDDRGFASAEINVLASEEFAAQFGTAIVAGRDDGGFDPSGSVSRQQMASFLGRAFLAIAEAGGGSVEYLCEGVFPDQDRISPAHRDNVDLLCAFEITSGRADGTFGPTADVTRGQMAAFIMRAFDVFANDGVQATLLPDRNFVVAGADCDGRQTGTATEPFCTITQAAESIAGVTDDLAVIRVRPGTGSGGTYQEAGVSVRAAEGSEVVVVGQPQGVGVGLEGSLFMSAAEDAVVGLVDFDVAGGPNEAAVRTGGAGEAVLLRGDFSGQTAIQVQQDGDESVTVALDSVLTGTDRVVNVGTSSFFAAEGTTFVSDGAEAFLVLPAGENPALLDSYTGEAVNNTFDPADPVATSIGNSPALVPAD